MSRVWAIARHMIAEAIRMKIAVAFILLIALMVFGLPFTVRGDDTITGAVKTYMDYALSATTLLLCALTIFMSRSVSNELVDRQIFVLVTKPVARWQYILGKWLGMMTLNFALLFAACAGVYGMTYVIARRPTHVPGDREQLRNEVLVARHASPVHVPEDELVRQAREHFEQRKTAGAYDGQPEFDPQSPMYDPQAEAKELDRIIKVTDSRWRTVGPSEERDFEFHDILCDRSRRLEAELTGDGAASGTARYDEYADEGKTVRRLQVDVVGARGNTELTVRIDDRRAGPIVTDASGFGQLVVTDRDGQAWPEDLGFIREDSVVVVGAIIGGPFESVNNLRMRYKAMAINTPSDELLRTNWRFGSAERDTLLYLRIRRDALDKYHKIPVPTDAVDDNRVLKARVGNPTYRADGQFDIAIAQFPPDAQLEVLFGVGSFVGNLGRWFVLTMCRLMFLAAVALLAVSLFSYPVAFLVSMTVFALASFRGYIGESYEFLQMNEAPLVLAWIFKGVELLLRGLFLIIPSFSKYDATEVLVDGRNVTLVWVLTGIGELVLLQTAAVALLGCLIFWKREVAEVSV